MAIFVNLSPTSSHFHPLQVEHCDSNSRLVVDEDDTGKLRLERVNVLFRESGQSHGCLSVYDLDSGHIALLYSSPPLLYDLYGSLFC